VGRIARVRFSRCCSAGGSCGRAARRRGLRAQSSEAGRAGG
jgi:hypothetical protein